MNGQKIGYIRVSSEGQNTERQLEGVELDKCFVDKVSGKSMQRDQLRALIDYAREGDHIFVHSMDRLARNLDDLRQLVRTFCNNGISITFTKESLTFGGDDSPMSNLLLSVMGAFAEFERSLIKERQREGIAIAKKRGVYKGRKQSLTNEQILQLQKRVEARENKASLAREFGISRQTLYEYLKKDVS